MRGKRRCHIQHRPAQADGPLPTKAGRGRAHLTGETGSPQSRTGQFNALRDVLAHLTRATANKGIGRLNAETFNQRHRIALHQHHCLRAACGTGWFAPGQGLQPQRRRTQISPHGKPCLPIAARFIADIKLYRPFQQRPSIQAKCCQLPGIRAGRNDFTGNNIGGRAVAKIGFLPDARFNIAKHARTHCRQPRIGDRNTRHTAFKVSIKSNARNAQITHVKLGLNINILDIERLDERKDKFERAAGQRTGWVIDRRRTFFENLKPGMAQNGPTIGQRAA